MGGPCLELSPKSKQDRVKEQKQRSGKTRINILHAFPAWEEMKKIWNISMKCPRYKSAALFALHLLAVHDKCCKDCKKVISSSSSSSCTKEAAPTFLTNRPAVDTPEPQSVAQTLICVPEELSIKQEFPSSCIAKSSFISTLPNKNSPPIKNTNQRKRSSVEPVKTAPRSGNPGLHSGNPGSYSANPGLQSGKVPGLHSGNTILHSSNQQFHVLPNCTKQAILETESSTVIQTDGKNEFLIPTNILQIDIKVEDIEVPEIDVEEQEILGPELGAYSFEASRRPTT